MNYKKLYLESQQKLRTSEKRALDLQCERDAYLITVRQLSETISKIFSGVTIKIVNAQETPLKDNKNEQ